MSDATFTLLPRASQEGPRGVVPSGAPRRPAVATAWSTRPSIRAPRIVRSADLAIAVGALLAVFLAVNSGRMPRGLDAFLSMRVTLKNVILAVFFAWSLGVAFTAVGLYDAARVRTWTREMRRVLLAATLATLVACVFPLTSRSGSFAASSLLHFWALSAAGLAAVHTLRAHLAGHWTGRRRAIIVGTGPQALRVHRELCSSRSPSYQLLGFIDTVSADRSPFLRRRTLGSLDSLEPILAHDHVDEVFIGLPVKSHYPQVAEALRICERVGVKATYHADIFETEIARPRLHEDGLPALVEMQVAPEGWQLAVKRAIDVLGALAGLVLLSPLMLAAAVGIKLTSPGPVFFSQERYGLNRRRFCMFKFRTMVVGAERLQASLEDRNEANGPVFKIACDPRVTTIGRFLRRTSIDELPQLVNVLRGDMSLVGPRPLPLRDVALISRPADMRRFSVRPGLTCLWQVSGRSGIGFDEWVRLDLEYIDRWSLQLDFKVLVDTVPAVLRGTGAA